MGVKEELFSFRGLLVTLLHNVFIMGAIGIVFMTVWLWEGLNPLHGVYITSEEQALQVLLGANPDSDIRFVPKKGGK